MKKDARCAISYYSSVRATTVDWLWYPYIPYGKITIIQGDPGEGKTTFALKLAATLSNGEPLPDGSVSEPINILYQNAEDSATDTIKPRLELLGADCGRIAFEEDDEKRLSLTDNRLLEAIQRTNARLLILDPLQAFIPNNCDMGRAHDMREAMGCLARIAGESGCAVLIVGHMTKTSSTKGIYRGIGSIDIAAIARSILMIGRVEEDSNYRVMVHIKSNLAPRGNSVSFSFDADGKFQWMDFDGDYTMQDLLEAPSVYRRKNSHAEQILLEVLENGEILASEAYAKCLEHGLKSRTVEHAKKSLGISSSKRGGKWYWQLPGGLNLEKAD